MSLAGRVPCWDRSLFGFCFQIRIGVIALMQAVDESGGSGALPRDVQKQVDGHRRDGGVQHLVQLLQDISVCPCPSAVETQLNPG